MDTSDGKIREIWGRKFKIVKNGLDEAEVFSFIGGLIDQNNALASKLEHLDSLTKLAERTVIEANKQAQSTKKEGEEKANASAASIIAEAEEKARKEIDRITSEGERKARQSAQEKIAAAEQQAQSMLTAAEEMAESIKANAEKKANKIVSEAKERAEDLVNARAASAEKEAQSIFEEAKAKAEEEAHLIKQKSEQLLKRSKRISEGEIKEKLKRVYQGLLSSLEGIDETIALPIEEGKESEPAKPEPIVHAKAERKTKESPKQPPPSEEKVAVKESPALYQGTVELVIPPPLGLDRMLQLHKHLRNIPNIEVLNLGVSADKSITIRVMLENPTPLRSILEDLPEVETVADAPQDAEMTTSTKKTGERTPVKRIIVTTKK